MIVPCPQCHTKFRIAPKILERPQLRLRCTKCQHVFLITTQPTTTAQPDAQAQRPKPLGVVITFCNQKGGVAKTTSCFNIAIAMARLQQRVLCVDFDPQANLSLLMGCGVGTPSFYDTMISNGELANAIQWRYEGHPPQWICGGHPHTPQLPIGPALLSANQRLHAFPKYALQQPNSEQILLRALEPLRQQFDFILVDTPPTVKFFTINAIVAADCVVIPTQCSYLALQGVTQIEQVISAARSRFGRPKEPRLLLTLVDTNSTAATAIQTLLTQRYGKRLLPQVIPMDDTVPQAQILRQPLFDYAPQGAATLAYIMVANSLIREFAE